MPHADDNTHAYLLFDQDELEYDFGAAHPMQPRRLVAMMDLLESCGLWQRSDEASRLPLRAATDEELGLVHTPDYIAAVKRLSIPEEVAASQQERQERNELALRFGFGEGDTPAMPRMHEAAARIAGGTLVALSAVMGLPAGGPMGAQKAGPLPGQRRYSRVGPWLRARLLGQCSPGTVHRR